MKVPYDKPTNFDSKVPCLGLLHGADIAILEAHMLLLVLQFVVDILFGVFFQGLGPMEVTGSFKPFNGNFEIATTINNPHSIPISLSTIRHKSLELWL